MANKFNKRALADRSYLSFEFPQTNGRILQTLLPMLENCDISESRRANLAEYNPIGRNSTMFAFLGGKSRSMSVKFNITLLNVLDYISREGLEDKFKQHFNLFWEDKEFQKKAYFIYKDLLNVDLEKGIDKEGMDHAQKHRDFYQRIAKLKSNESNLFDEISNFSLKTLGIQVSNETNKSIQDKAMNKVINLIVFWVNLIRCSTINNSKNTSLGPPIVRLNHGIMYNNVPCVVENYSIRIISESGYDIETLLPKQLEMSLTMNEVRISESGNFSINNIEDSDGNVGWESVIDNNNMDPYTQEL